METSQQTNGAATQSVIDHVANHTFAPARKEAPAAAPLATSDAQMGGGACHPVVTKHLQTQMGGGACHPALAKHLNSQAAV